MTEWKKVPDTTAERTEKAAALLEATMSAPDPVVMLAAPSEGPHLVWANRAFVEVVKAEVADLASVPLPNLISCPFGALPLNEHRVSTFPASVIGRDGSLSVWDATAVPTLGEDRRLWMVTMRPPSGDHQLDDLLRASEERFRALAERAPIGIFSSEVGLRFGYVNDQLAELVGVPAERLLGVGWIDYLAPEDAERVSTGLQATLAREPFDGPARLRTAGGEERWVNIRAVPVGTEGMPAGFLGTVEDVTDRRRYEDLLAWQATHDPLTRLPNRAKLAEDLHIATDALTASGQDAPTPLSVLFFDLDDFKTVNDQLGHRAGDQLLMAVAERLTSAVRERDTVYRFAGDEFVVMAWGARDDGEALGMAHRLRHAVAQPLIVDGTEIPVRCSVGVVRAEPGLTPEDLIRDADAAMYRAKAEGKGAAAVFDRHQRDRRAREEAFVARVRDGIEQAAWTLEYLPVVHLETGRPVAVSASLRLDDPDRGQLGSPEIIDHAQRSGLLGPLTSTMADRVCADLAAWRAENAAPSWVLLELGDTQQRDDRLADHLARSLVSHGISRSALRIGLVSSAEGVHSSSEVVSALRALGIGLALDVSHDERTSLSELTGECVRTLILGAEFATSEVSASLVRALTAWATSEGLEVIAAGLSAADAAEQARARGVHLGMGEFFDPPRAGTKVPGWFGGRP
jgi:diguanylate cyclase (GGDEF)-like protein/PAS domain S-box-containing protein